MFNSKNRHIIKVLSISQRSQDCNSLKNVLALSKSIMGNSFDSIFFRGLKGLQIRLMSSPDKECGECSDIEERDELNFLRCTLVYVQRADKYSRWISKIQNA